MFNKIKSVLAHIKAGEEVLEQTPVITEGIRLLEFISGFVNFVEQEMAKAAAKNPDQPTTVSFSISCEHGQIQNTAPVAVDMPVVEVSNTDAPVTVNTSESVSDATIDNPVQSTSNPAVTTSAT